LERSEREEPALAGGEKSRKRWFRGAGGAHRFRVFEQETTRAKRSGQNNPARLSSQKRQFQVTILIMHPRFERALPSSASPRGTRQDEGLIGQAKGTSEATDKRNRTAQ